MPANEDVSDSFIMPHEGGPHTATWMVYGASERSWGRTGVYGMSRDIARRDLIRIAAMLSRFEPVNMLIANEADWAQAEQLLSEIQAEKDVTYAGDGELPSIEAAGKIRFILCKFDDLWVRDNGPVFVHNGKKLYGVDFNFNGWGLESTGAPGWKKDQRKVENGIFEPPIANDKGIAKRIIELAGAERLTTWLVSEGGALDVNGKGTAMITESSILNPNRNPGKSKADVEAELNRLLGIRKVIWLPGLAAHEVTDGHVDYYARFVGESTVICALDKDPESPDSKSTYINAEILSAATDANGNKLNVIYVTAPNFSMIREIVEARYGWDSESPCFNGNEYAAGYLGYYQTQRCILMAKFGDEEADKEALKIISSLYPGRFVIQIPTDGIANTGGTIHCTTMQQIRVP